jgi:periplasmic protein TonB
MALNRHPILLLVSFALLSAASAQQTLAPDTTPSIASAPQKTRKSCAPTPNDYPAASLRANEQGTTRLGFKVLASGELGSVTVLKSSGFPRLDHAAIGILKTCALPTKKDAEGNAVEASYSVVFAWRVE